MADPAAAVVAGEHEALVAERRHDLDHVLRHRALGVGGVLRVGGRLAAVAVAAQVGADDGEALGQRRRHAVPHGVGLRIAVQEQERRPRAADPRPDRGLARCDVAHLETVEHGVFSLLRRRALGRCRRSGAAPIWCLRLTRPGVKVLSGCRPVHARSNSRLPVVYPGGMRQSEFPQQWLTGASVGVRAQEVGQLAGQGAQRIKGGNQ